ncbi:hypothetical protein TRIUR3_16514 [Triticum urartu]|uniref:Uncharacterized protein n=1 Tax=Triticum urartu TaxID=4572 RepID=M8A0V7_TRIUA|nr:hypothetical protein TRIUR3_16514 [Triticum urartu]
MTDSSKLCNLSVVSDLASSTQRIWAEGLDGVAGYAVVGWSSSDRALVDCNLPKPYPDPQLYFSLQFLLLPNGTLYATIPY